MKRAQQAGDEWARIFALQIKVNSAHTLQHGNPPLAGAAAPWREKTVPLCCWLQ
jgi:hypothetical protein